MPPSSRLLLLYRNLQPFSSVSPSPMPINRQNTSTFRLKPVIPPQKTLMHHSKNKNRHLMPRSVCTIKPCQHICCFFLCFYPPTSIHLIFNAPHTNHHKFRSNYNPKSILFTRSVPINRPSTSKTANHPQSSHVTTMFSSHNRK